MNICGEFTHLEGDRCIPDFAPTQCDPDTTTPEIVDGVTVCKGQGGCESEIQCPTPTSANKQTICGRIYDFTLGQPTAASRFTDGAMPMPMTCDPMMPASLDAIGNEVRRRHDGHWHRLPLDAASGESGSGV